MWHCCLGCTALQPAVLFCLLLLFLLLLLSGGGGGGGSFVKVDVQAYSGNGSILAADKET